MEYKGLYYKGLFGSGRCGIIMKRRVMVAVVANRLYAFRTGSDYLDGPGEAAIGRTENAGSRG